MAKTVLFIVGADKGGVGKTTIARCLLEYLRSKGVEAKPFDTQADNPKGSLKRFYPQAEIVDFTDTDGQVKVLDNLSGVNVVDLPASGLSPALKLLAEVGFLNSGKFEIIVLHVLGTSPESADEIRAVSSAIGGARYVAIGNRTGATKFSFPSEALDIPALDAAAREAIDAAGQSYFDFVNANVSPVKSGKVRHWLSQVGAQFDKASLANICI